MHEIKRRCILRTLMKMTLFRAGCGFALLMLLAAVNGAEPAKTQSRPLLWEIKSARGAAYLLGSIHAAKADLYPLDERIERAFEESDILVVEVNMLEQTENALPEQLLARSLYPHGDDLTKRISPALFEQAQVRMAKHGFTAAQIKQFKPWYIATTLTLLELRALGIVPELGIDMHYLNRARGRKKILALESAEAHIDRLDGFNDREQELYLKQTVTAIDNLAGQMEEVFTAWNSGDGQRLAQLLDTSHSESAEGRSIRRKLVDQRNRAMAAKITRLLRTGKTYFIIVGAGHLIGDKGLPNLLAKNHQVRPL
jgi:uncharacterized protein YbaP (TraB family)